jgi:hypothetical protein
MTALVPSTAPSRWADAGTVVLGRDGRDGAGDRGMTEGGGAGPPRSGAGREDASALDRWTWPRRGATDTVEAAAGAMAGWGVRVGSVLSVARS